MAPRNGTTSTPPKLVVTLPSGTLQWHPAMAPCPLAQSWSSPSPLTPCNGTTSTPPKLVITLPPTAHYNGTLQRHHIHTPSPPPQPWHTTMAPHDSTQQWHHVLCTLQWHPGATSNPPKWFVALPPCGFSIGYMLSPDKLTKRTTTTNHTNRAPSDTPQCFPLQLT